MAGAGTGVAVAMRVRSLVLIAMLATAARADGFYFTEGVGGTAIRGRVGAIMPSATRIRISAGERAGHWAVEAWLAADFDDSPTENELDTFGVDLKYLQPLSRHFEVYLRGSMSAANGFGAFEDFGGRGLGFGAGIAVRGKVSPWGLLWAPLFFLVRSGPKMTGALWLDDGYDFYRLHSPDHPYTLDAGMSHITFGFALGSDF